MINIVILISLVDELHFSIALSFLQFGTWEIDRNDCLGSSIVEKGFSLIFIFTVVERLIFWIFLQMCRLKRDNSCFLILNLFAR